jgi:hypothetical protein
MTLDLNGATLKENAFTGHGAVVVSIANVRDAHLVNGTIEGDYYEHDYKVPARLEHVALESVEGWTRLSKPPPHRRVWDDASHPAEPYWGEPNFRTPSGVVVSPLWTIHGERYVVYWD